ncbi:MAG: protein-L-isoaspartate(D-aspartate) O-methyltransferase [Cyclobacteriaceae bacterium]|nr:protein-L-isoaspartate(D-aspartate) O-methyltransferase [Cyclobacteriaceae bacterium]
MFLFARFYVFLFLLVAFPDQRDQDDYVELRKDMVERQIRNRGVNDQAVLNAMLKVPRHLFVPDHQQPYAYDDRPLSIGNNQTISQPYIVGFMTEAISPEKGDKVLEIGTGSGYQAAVLAEIVDKVYTIEIISELADRAENTFKRLGYDNIYSMAGDGYAGWPEEAPFDAIMVTAAPEEIPPPLIEQLKEGGRMIIPVGPIYRVQSLQLLIKRNGKMKVQDLLPVRFVPFTREEN